MTIHNEMCLFKVTIYRNLRNSLLTHLSTINNIHIKTKKESISKSKLASATKEEKAIVENIKKLRKNADVLFRKLKISEYDFQQLKVDNREEFLGKDVQELLNHISEEVNFYANRINELERYIAKATIELENINLIKKCYTFLEKYNLNRFSVSYFNQLDFRLYTTFTKNFQNLQNLFDFSVFPNVHLTSNISSDRIVFVIVYPKDREDDLKERIRLIHAEEVNILKKYLMYDKINFDRINKEIDFVEKTLSKYRLELDRIRHDNLLKFAAIDEVIQNIEEYNWAERQFEELSSTRSVLRFFIPIDDSSEVEKVLIKTFKDKITIESINIPKKRKTRLSDRKKSKESKKMGDLETSSEDDLRTDRDTASEEELRNETPTIMRNRFFIKPFEAITKLYGTPTYSETDPTPFIAISFPLLFGLMFGDIGHGIVLVISGLIGAFMFRKSKGNIKDYSWIIFYCGWGAILGGFLYGEFFGMHEIFGFHLEPVTIPIINVQLYNPLENIMTVFYFTILIGVIHINLGWFIQMLNYWKQSMKYLAVSDSLVKIALLTGGAVLIFTWGLDVYAWFSFPYPILLPLIPGLLLILLKPMGRLLGVSYLKEESFGELMGEGSMEAFETLLSVMSNVASYVRLLALALAHIALMVAIRAMIDLLPSEGEIFIEIIRIIGLIFGNLVVILLEGVIAFINAIRLHFYEFFFKFYKGSGTEFFPFYLDNDYSIINFKVDTEKDIISEEIEKEISIKNAKENIERAVNYITDKYLYE